MAQSEFFKWLQEDRPDGLIYRTYAEHKDWHTVTNIEAAWRLIAADDKTDDAKKSELRDSAAHSFVAFHKSREKRNWFGGLTAYGIGIFLFMSAIIGILAGVIFEGILGGGAASDQPLLARLKDVETARGLITFVFTIGVIALALIIVTANVTGQDDDGKKFERSKEILTALIAILGTILGYYFGVADSDPEPEAPEVEVEAAASPAGAGEDE